MIQCHVFTFTFCMILYNVIKYDVPGDVTRWLGKGWL